MRKANSKSVVICSNHAWAIYNFRMPLIRFLKKKGFKVIVITEFDGYEKEISKEVDQINSLRISRKGMNPFYDLITFLDFIKYLLIIRPSILLLYTIKPVIYGSIAARILKVPSISTITGLGTAFLSKSWLTKLVKRFYKIALSNSSVVFFQNTDDRGIFLDESLVSKSVTRLSPGSGVDFIQFRSTPLSENKQMKFILIARMLWDKGVGEYIEAARIVKNSFPDAIFQLLGPINVENRTAISQEQMNKWVSEGIIEYLGQSDSVERFIDEATCIVLPSYREGISKVLLESAAMCRPIISSNVPGCREIVEHGFNGFICEPKDKADLAAKMIDMILLTHDNRKKMGINGRIKVEKEFDQEIVLKLYFDAINDSIGALF